MYVPGQALFLAAGKLLTGWHWAGVLAGAMFAVTSLLWMLRALFPPPWAFLGAAFYTCRVGMFSGWTEGYWGGHVAAAAGALLIGSVVRIRRQPDARYAIVFGLSGILLAWTRPFEGLLIFSAASLFLVAAFFRSAEKRVWLKLVALPAGALLVTCACMTGYFCYRVTGSPVKLPYSVNRENYGWPMTLPWLQPRPIQHRHLEHALYYAWELSEHENITNPAEVPKALVRKLRVLLSFSSARCWDGRCCPGDGVRQICLRKNSSSRRAEWCWPEQRSSKPSFPTTWPLQHASYTRCWSLRGGPCPILRV